MKSYLFRRSKTYLGFGRTEGALWPLIRLGWATLEIFPGELADRLSRLIEKLRNEVKK